jgi:hypothetical protein
MKNLVLVSGMHDVPVRFRSIIYVVNVNSREEAILFLSGKKYDVVMFWGAGVPVERLLKSVEYYEGNLLVYSEVDVDSVMRSRFTRVLRGKQSVRWVRVAGNSEMEDVLKRLKVSMGFGA